MSTSTTTSGGKKAGARKPTAAPASGKERDPLLLRNGSTKADVSALSRALAVYKIAHDETASPADLIGLVRGELSVRLEKLDDSAKMVCDDCGEKSTEDTDFCPYCGSSEEAPSAPVAEKAKANGASKANGAAAKQSEETALAAKGAALTEAIARIESLKGDMAANSYDLGLEIKRIHEEELWKARGRASFREFIEEDLTIGRSMAYKLMEVTTKFDRETFLKVGSSKLALVADIEDPAARDAALEAARNGASRRDLDRKAGKAPDKKAAASAPPKKGPNEITLLAKVGSKAELYQWRSASSGRPIKAHAEDAYVEIPISDEVVQQIALKLDRDGAVVGLTAKFVRAE